MATSDVGRSLNQSLIGILVRREVLTPEQASVLSQTPFNTQQELEEHLTLNCEVEPDEICLALAEHARVPVIRLSHFTVRDDLLRDYPPEILKRHRVAPIARTSTTITLAVADPLDVFAIEEIADFSGLRVIPVAALENEVLDLVAGIASAPEDGLDEILQEAGDANIEFASDDTAGDRKSVV